MCFFKSKESFDTVLKKYFSEPYTLDSVQPMRELFQSLKRTNFEVFLAYLKNNEEIKNNFRDYLFILFSNKSFSKALTDANILSENAFFPELKKRISYKFLPPVEDENTVSYIISKVLFNPKSDSNYIKNINPEDGSEFFKLMEIEKISTLPKVKKELLISANILALRSVGNALEAGIAKMVPEYKNFDNPFVALQSELDSLIYRFKKDKDLQIDSKDVDYKQIKIYLQQCLDFVDKAFKNASKFGISSKINQSLLKIRQQLKRIQDIIPILVVDNEEDISTNSKNLVSNTLKYNSHRNNVRELIDDSTRLISHLITSHTAETGTHYIATSSKEYLKMFWKASGGGIIVGFLCIFKMMMSYSHGSEFSHAVLYSLNYAFGFIIIYLLGFTLATKQPAMTAATMAKVLSDESSSEKNYKEFANLVAKLSRTQFIAFVGNVLWSFPVALAIIYGMDWFLDKNFAVAKADKLLKDLNPIESKAILHACIAGFFLFISGIISGNISNSSIFNQVPERISQSPFLNQVIGAKNSKKLSNFYTKHWAGIISNFWFGIFLGVIAPLGVFLGLDLDIRHITFSAGNFALALYGKGFDIDTYTFVISLVTIFLIGAFNFIVSFGLSMLLAFRSRKVNFGELTIIHKTILKYFIKNPLRFFIPLKSELDEASKDLIQDNKTHH
ncbi:MAG: recombinase [Flavobacteriaceae bacterium]|nr:recombinase [Flavobacteriaceae bacterium]